MYCKVLKIGVPGLLYRVSLSTAKMASSAFVRGGFAPVRAEHTAPTPLEVRGRLPTDLTGVYVKNGPNAQFPPSSGTPYHWFDGDGMVHAVALDGANNSATYVNRWVRTERFLRDRERGDTVNSFGEMQAGNMMAVMDPRGISSETGKILGRMHTNVVFHGGRLLALEETDKPYEMVLPTLETRGQFDFDGTLRHIMCAHPKICPNTGEMFVFGHEIDPMQEQAVASYSVVSGKKGIITHSMDVPLRGPRFMHDMAITQNFAIIFDLPSTFDFSEWQEGRSPWVHRADTETRFGIFPRHCQDPSRVRWFRAKSCQIFHTINAFETEDGSAVVLRCCRADSYTMGFDGSDKPKFWLYPYEWRFDMRTGETVCERRIADVRCDFPVVSRAVVGAYNQFSYYTSYRARDGDGVPLYDGLVKIDHGSNSSDSAAVVVAEIKLGVHQSCGECSFVPKKLFKNNKKCEDDGYLVMFVSDARTPEVTELWVYCAKTLSSTSEPLARIVMPQRVPYGFHGNWLDEVEMKQAAGIRSRL